MWFDQNASQFERLKNLTVISISQESTRAMAAMAARNMTLQCNIQEGQVWLMDENENVEIEQSILKSAADKNY